MSITQFYPWALLVAVTTACCGLITSDAYSQDGGIPTAEIEENNKPDPFEIPDGGADAKLEFIQKLRQMRPQGANRAEMVANAMKAQETILAASEQILAMSDVPQETRATAVESIFGSLTMLARLGNTEALQQLTAVAEQYKDDKNAKISELAKTQLIVARARNLDSASDEEIEQLIADIAAGIKADPSSQLPNVAMQIGRLLDNLDKPELAATAMNQFADALSQSDDEAARKLAERFQGMARGFDLLGKPLDLQGVTVDGKPLDWASYRGKVVLVDYWATWCGPCIAELPNVKAAYEAYHDAGFEVLGISLDDDRQKLEEFIAAQDIPWTNLFSDDPDSTGWRHPMATYYGVSAIPTVLLVDQQGIVVNTKARGPVLEEELAKLLGPPKKPAETEEAADEDKPADSNASDSN